MVIEDLDNVFAPLKLFGLTHSFAAGGAENFGETRHLAQIKTPITL